eukprot:50493_1
MAPHCDAWFALGDCFLQLRKLKNSLDKCNMSRISSMSCNASNCLSTHAHYRKTNSIMAGEADVPFLATNGALSGSLGKTTILKQIKKIHDHDAGGELNERKVMPPFVRLAMIDYMKRLCAQSVELNTAHNEDTRCIRREMVALQYPYQLTEQITTLLSAFKRRYLCVIISRISWKNGDVCSEHRN